MNPPLYGHTKLIQEGLRPYAWGAFYVIFTMTVSKRGLQYTSYLMMLALYCHVMFNASVGMEHHELILTLKFGCWIWMYTVHLYQKQVTVYYLMMLACSCDHDVQCQHRNGASWVNTNFKVWKLDILYRKTGYSILYLKGYTIILYLIMLACSCDVQCQCRNRVNTNFKVWKLDMNVLLGCLMVGSFNKV